MRMPGRPYHLTDEASAAAILRNGLRPLPPDEDMAQIRGALDDARPPEYPAHSESVFFYPPDGPDPRGRTAIEAIPRRVPNACVIADKALLDDVLDHRPGSEGERRVLAEYWRNAKMGSMGEVAAAEAGYRDPEIFCAGRVPPGALERRGRL